MFDDCALRHAFWLAAESGRLAACAPNPGHPRDPWVLLKPTFPHNLALVSVLYFGERPEMISHDGKSRKATTKTKSTKGTKSEITRILQTHSGDHTGNRT